MSGAPSPPSGTQGPIAPGSATFVPTREVGGSAFAGAVSVLVIWALNNYALPPTKPITPEIASSITTVLSFVAGYLIREPA